MKKNKLLNSISDKIVKHNKLILIIFLVMAVLSVVSIFTLTKVNSDITSYLPDNTYTTDGFDFLSENFGIKGDLIVTVTGLTEKEIKPYIDSISNIKLVTSVNWIGASTFNLLKYTSPEGYELVKEVFVKGGDDIPETERIYAIMMTMDCGPSTDEAFEIIDSVNKILAGVDHGVSGSTEMAKSIFDGTINEIGGYMVVAIIIVLFLLIITTHSFIDPLILLLTLGVSILVNMGTNFILKEVSIITFSASAILQLGLSMDYAIFLLHKFRKLKAEGQDTYTATKNSIPQTLATISASALTTVGGFAALYFMKFTIGADLAGVLIKGIVLSLITVLCLQPALIIIFNKLADKTEHRYINLHFRKSIGFAMRHRIIFVFIAIVMLLPSVFLQSNLSFNYLKFEAEEENPTAYQEYADNLLNQIMLCVPVDKNNLDEQYALLNHVNENTNVEFTLGLCAMMDKATVQGILNSSISNPMLDSYLSNGYTLYTVGLNVPIESEEAQSAINYLHAYLDENFADAYYMTGTAQAVSDFAEITPADFKMVTIISVIVIFIILLFTLKSFTHSLLLVILIEFGIWINLGISYLFGGTINFMSYMIISSIQLGATVDYAILTSTDYLKNRKAGQLPENAAFNATTSNAMAILTSASIMCAACLSVYFMSSNLIVGEITMLIARGSIISVLLVLFVLPTVLTLTSNILEKTENMQKQTSSSDVIEDEKVDKENES